MDGYFKEGGHHINVNVLNREVLLDAMDHPELYPQLTIEYIKAHAKDFKKGAVVVDCAGVKRVICEQVQAVAAENGFTFVGAHPMAGVERSGFTYSTADMFNGATWL